MRPMQLPTTSAVRGPLTKDLIGGALGVQVVVGVRLAPGRDGRANGNRAVRQAHERRQQAHHRQAVEVGDLRSRPADVEAGRGCKGAWLWAVLSAVYGCTPAFTQHVWRERGVRRCTVSALQRQAVARRLTWERNSCMPAKTTIQAEMPKDGQGLWQ